MLSASPSPFPQLCATLLRSRPGQFVTLRPRWWMASRCGAVTRLQHTRAVGQPARHQRRHQAGGRRCVQHVGHHRAARRRTGRCDAARWPVYTQAGFRQCARCCTPPRHSRWLGHHAYPVHHGAHFGHESRIALYLGLWQPAQQQHHVQRSAARPERPLCPARVAHPCAVAPTARGRVIQWPHRPRPKWLHCLATSVPVEQITEVFICGPEADD